jgi:hypothetical protein
MALCTITGTLTSVTGQAMGREPVAFSVDKPANEVVFLGSRALGDAERVEYTDENGDFSVALEQGLQVIVRIDAINLHRQVTVPLLATATLEELVNGDL